jgi:hypothetical protein
MQPAPDNIGAEMVLASLKAQAKTRKQQWRKDVHSAQIAAGLDGPLPQVGFLALLGAFRHAVAMLNDPAQRAKLEEAGRAAAGEIVERKEEACCDLIAILPSGAEKAASDELELLGLRCNTYRRRQGVDLLWEGTALPSAVAAVVSAHGGTVNRCNRPHGPSPDATEVAMIIHDQTPIEEPVQDAAAGAVEVETIDEGINEAAVGADAKAKDTAGKRSRPARWLRPTPSDNIPYFLRDAVDAPVLPSDGLGG